jgi:hypothetical protein
VSDLVAFPDVDLPAMQVREDNDRLREFIARHLKRMANHGEQAADYARILLRSGADVSDQLNEMEATANALLLTALLFKREAGGK